MVGRRIESAEVLDERWTRPGPAAATEEALPGRRIEAVARRGKYLIVRLDDGSALVMHLRMTGNLLLPARSGEVADLMESERLGGPRLYESHRRALPAGADRRRRVGALVHRRAALRSRRGAGVR